jgi:RNA polymerase sigma factor (sigma-70 family)
VVDATEGTIGATLTGERRRELLRFFRLRLSDATLSEDLCQELGLRAVLADAAGTRPRDADAWLARVAGNLLVDAYRRRASSSGREEPLEGSWSPAGAAAADELLERRELQRDLTAALRALPPTLRTILYAHDVDGLTPRAIAAGRGCSPRVVSTLLSRARRRLRVEYLRRRCAGLLEPGEDVFEDPAPLPPLDPTAGPDELLGAVEARVRGFLQHVVGQRADRAPAGAAARHRPRRRRPPPGLDRLVHHRGAAGMSDDTRDTRAAGAAGTQGGLVDVEDLPALQIWAGVVARPVEGEHVSAAVVELEANAVVPEHHHPHEQLGLCITGSVIFRIGAESRRLGPGGTWRIPAQAPHEVLAGPEGAVVVDIFSPIREDWHQAPAAPPSPPRWP